MIAKIVRSFWILLFLSFFLTFTVSTAQSIEDNSTNNKNNKLLTNTVYIIDGINTGNSDTTGKEQTPSVMNNKTYKSDKNISITLNPYRESANLKSKSDEALLKDRIKLKRTRSLNDVPQKQRVENLSPGKLNLFSLPDKVKKAQTDCPRCKGIEELKEKTQEEKDPQIRERDLLLLAGKYVGQDDWEFAQRIYKELEVNSKDPGVIEAVRRNLKVVNLKLSILAETDSSRKEILELELANLHRELGHYQASKRIYRCLAKEAKNTQIRSQAREFLTNKQRPTRPPIPVNLKKLEQIDPQMPPPANINEDNPLQEGTL